MNLTSLHFARWRMDFQTNRHVLSSVLKRDTCEFELCLCERYHFFLITLTHSFCLSVLDRLAGELVQRSIKY